MLCSSSQLSPAGEPSQHTAASHSLPILCSDTSSMIKKIKTEKKKTSQRLKLPIPKKCPNYTFLPIYTSILASRQLGFSLGKNNSSTPNPLGTFSLPFFATCHCGVSHRSKIASVHNKRVVWSLWVTNC